MPIRLLFFLTAVNILNYFDRYIVHSVEPLLKAEFVLSNQESGLLVSAFVFGYFLLSPLFGYLGDRYDRRYLMAIGLLAWSAATAITGFTSTFLTFFAARVFVGIGEASFGTIVPGYLKGRIPDTLKLNSALSLFYCAIPVGAALGYVLGGTIAARYSWRDVFLIAAVPGVLLSIGFFFVRKEDPVEVSSSTPDGFLSSIKAVLAVPILRLAILGYIFNTFALNGIAAFVVRYGSALGMAMEDVSQNFGLILLVTGFFGTFGGGTLASFLARGASNKVKSLLTFVSISTFIGLPFLCAAFLVTSPNLFLVCCFGAELMLFAGVAPLNLVLVARAPRGLETLTQGVTIFLINLFGSILAPIAIGAVSDMLLRQGVTATTGAPDLAYAMQLSSIAALFSALLWWIASRRDVEPA
jgi:MFS family permease